MAQRACAISTWPKTGARQASTRKPPAGATCIWSGRKPLTFKSSMPLRTAEEAADMEELRQQGAQGRAKPLAPLLACS